MCLGIPVKITAITDPEKMLALAEVKGVRREVNVALVCAPGETLEALVGTWVLLHVGFAVSRIDEAEARITLDLLDATGLEEELAAMAPS
ncbi:MULTISPECIES: HypC/HybG/HupF family hydrogenase formation chaperone [Rhodopseudomonas]|uniref:Hydrogenase maturation factor HypC n=1 Tax=Rhodopseudomonas palustris TaxID=1076 RepID=A0A0D7EUP2_RHOPL|nr:MULTISPECIES: HypC/HybG/HupF family hydrogenase formation chaperone [Rhodopseudomonas]KIZ43162.1 hydrogenase assembly protein HupF [Rhodopseudomonas palustris]MDF3809524.1 HypC/HybG/HupF family hydrogenase formation chaperone [Rhodopseudomonas sp. BAL398]WOK19726.1 HypC/HybG/HupF family hydrogenase formation chaperone [Rhodopseudomonas sp. BAL398]